MAPMIGALDSPLWMFPRKALRFVRLMLGRAGQLAIFQAASALAFSWLLAMVPLMTVALALTTQTSFFAEFQAEVKAFILSNFLPDGIGRQVPRFFDDFVKRAGRLSVISLAFLLISATAMMLTIDRVLGRIFRVRRPRPLWVRIPMYSGVLILGPLVTAVSVVLIRQLILEAGTAGGGTQGRLIGVAVLEVFNVLVVALTFALAYRFIPGPVVRSSDAFWGGLLAALLTEAAQQVFGRFFATLPTYKAIYGPLAAIPLLFVWSYITWAVFLLGALFASMLPSWPYCGASIWRQEARHIPRRRARRGEQR